MDLGLWTSMRKNKLAKCEKGLLLASWQMFSEDNWPGSVTPRLQVDQINTEEQERVLSPRQSWKEKTGQAQERQYQVLYPGFDQQQAEMQILHPK